MNPLSSKLQFEKDNGQSEYMQQQKHVFGEEDICYCLPPLPSQDRTSKSSISQAPLPTGFYLDFVREITLEDRKFGEEGGGRNKRYCHLFSSLGLISSHVVIPPPWSQPGSGSLTPCPLCDPLILSWLCFSGLPHGAIFANSFTTNSIHGLPSNERCGGALIS